MKPEQLGTVNECMANSAFRFRSDLAELIESNRRGRLRGW
jgi:hypothetical protein